MKEVLIIFSAPLRFEYLNVEPDFFDGVLQSLRPKYKGPYVSFGEESVQITRYSKEEKEILKPETRKLYLKSNEEFTNVQNKLDKLNRKIVSIKADGDCLFEAILKQVHHPPDYTARMLRKQVAFYIAKNVEVFKEYVEPICITKSMDENVNQCFESYVENVYRGTIWGDNIIAGAIGRMWNVSISIVSHAFDKVLHLYHNNDRPSIVLVANGGFLGSERPTSHFSATGIYFNIETST